MRDKTPPVISCPTPVTVNCDYGIDLNNLKEFGQVVDHPSKIKNITIHGKIVGKDGTAIDTCGVVITESVRDLRKCHEGQIIRTFYATDASGNVDSCSQIITVINETPFNINNIIWPKDTTLVNCKVDSVPVLATGIPIYKNERCASVIANYEDQIFETNEATNCFKIIRRWKVLDWCAFEKGEKESTFYHDQLIKLTNHIAPQISTTCSDTTLCINADTCGMVTYQKTFSATDDCTPINRMRWDWTIDINNNGSQDFTGITREIRVSLPKGTHRVNLRVQDGCGNTSTCTYVIIVKDCKAPTPYCIQSLSTAIMQNGTITVKAKDFNRGSTDNCSSNDKLRFSFSRNLSDSTRIFTCDSLKSLKVRDFSLQMWVTDEEGNQDYCNALLTVQDNANICNGSNGLTTINGNITDVHGFGVSNYTITVKDTEDKIVFRKTYATPDFVIDSVFSEKEYKLYIEKENILGSEVNVFDLLKIQRHILGIKRFASPLEILAADVDNNQRVNVTDIIEIRKYILGITDMYDTPLKVWQFVEENIVFENISRPERNQVYIQTGKLKIENNTLPVKAYQLGNVESFGSSLQSRSAQNLQLSAEKNDHEMVIKSVENIHYEAIELTLEHDYHMNTPYINPNFEDRIFIHKVNPYTTRIIAFQAGGLDISKNDWLIKLDVSRINSANGIAIFENDISNVTLSQNSVSKYQKIYQNYDRLMIETDMTDFEIILYDFNGHEMMKDKIRNGEHSFSIESLKTGYYIFRLHQNGDIRTGKVYIQR